MIKAWTVVAIGALAATAACSKGKDDKAAPAGSGSAVAATPAGSGSSSSGSGAGSGSAAKGGKHGKHKKDHDKKVAATADQKGDYKQHMKAGWAAQKDKKWADAVGEFDKALVAIPGEQRALAELGWSAMNAGDYVRAKKADEQAIAVAVDAKVKAAGYYNLGQVLEKNGDKDGAVKAYGASLVLRPNKTVQEAVAKLGKDPAKPDDSPVCAVGATPCDCAQKSLSTPGIDAENATCKLEASDIAGFQTVSLNGENAGSQNSYDFLFDEATGAYITDLGYDAEYHGGRNYEQHSVEKLELRTIGGHKVLWIELAVKDEDVEMHDDDMVTQDLHGTEVTVCVIGDAKTPTRCPLVSVPLQHTTEKSSDSMDNKKHDGGGTVVQELTLDIANDGTATYKLVKGPSDEQIDGLVGPHKLW